MSPHTIPKLRRLRASHLITWHDWLRPFEICPRQRIHSAQHSGYQNNTKPPLDVTATVVRLCCVLLYTLILRTRRGTDGGQNLCCPIMSTTGRGWFDLRAEGRRMSCHFWNDDGYTHHAMSCTRAAAQPASQPHMGKQADDIHMEQSDVTIENEVEAPRRVAARTHSLRTPYPSSERRRNASRLHAT